MPELCACQCSRSLSSYRHVAGTTTPGSGASAPHGGATADSDDRARVTSPGNPQQGTPPLMLSDRSSKAQAQHKRSTPAEVLSHGAASFGLSQASMTISEIVLLQTDSVDQRKQLRHWAQH